MTQFFGYIAVITGLLCLLPQIIKSYKTKSTGDVSLSMWLLLALTNASWLIHGLFNEDFPLIIANVISLVLVCLMISIKLRYIE